MFQLFCSSLTCVMKSRIYQAMARLLFVALLLLCTLVARAEDEKGSVLELTDVTIDAAIANHDYIFIDFYAPWCFHCKKLFPELDAAAPVLAENVPQIILAKINADKYSKIASRFDISGYPTLKFFIKGYPVEYKGPRQAATLTSHLQKLTNPDVTVLENEAELDNFLQQNTDDRYPLFIGFGIDSSLVSEFAKENKNKAWFLVLNSFSGKSMESFDFDKSPALVALRRGQQEQETFYGPFEGDDLALFIKQNLLPRVSQLTFESLRALREDGRPIALAVLNDGSSEHSESFIKKLKAAAPANRAFVFAYVDVSKWPSLVESFDIDLKAKVPGFIVWTDDSTYFMSSEGYNFAGERAEAYITLFLQEYKEGMAKKLSVKGPSFTDFLWSLVSMRTVYILIVIVGVFVFAQTMLALDLGDVQKIQSGQEGTTSGRDKHRSISTLSSSEGSSSDAPHASVKED